MQDYYKMKLTVCNEDIGIVETTEITSRTFYQFLSNNPS